MKTHYYYTFKYQDGTVRSSGGFEGLSITGNIDHSLTKVGDVIEIEQFNISGSRPSKAEIVGKLEFNWDMSKPIGQRKSEEVVTGVGYLVQNKFTTNK